MYYLLQKLLSNELDLKIILKLEKCDLSRMFVHLGDWTERTEYILELRETSPLKYSGNKFIACGMNFAFIISK